MQEVDEAGAAPTLYLLILVPRHVLGGVGLTAREIAT